MYQVQRKFKDQDSVWEPSSNGPNFSKYESLEAALSMAREWLAGSPSISYRVVDLRTGRPVSNENERQVYKIETRLTSNGEWLYSLNAPGLFTKKEAVSSARANHLKSFCKLSYRVINTLTGKTVYRVQRLKHTK